MKAHTKVVSSSLVAVICAALLASSGAAAAGAGPDPVPGEPTLAEVRQATARFTDVNVALKEGYIRDPFDLCDTAAMMVSRLNGLVMTKASSGALPVSRYSG